MPGDDLFVAEEAVIAAAERLVADGGFPAAAERQHYEQLLKSYQKLFRTARRLMRLGDHNERQLNAAAEVIDKKNKELESLSTKLSKYLSPQIYNSIFTGAQGVEMASNRKKLTIFFSDVVNFTETTEKLESEDLTNLLNRYLTEMSDIALQHGATIDKYIGDAIMVFFGDPESRGLKEDARACVRMAIAMLRRMHELRSEWQELGAEKPFRVRIGVNTRLLHRRQFRQPGPHGLHNYWQRREFDGAAAIPFRDRRHPLGSRDLFAGQGRGFRRRADPDQGEGLCRADPLLQGCRALRPPRRGRDRDPRGARGVQVPPQPAKARQGRGHQHPRRHSLAPEGLSPRNAWLLPPPP